MGKSKKDHILIIISKILVTLLRLMYSLLNALLFRNRQEYPYIQNYLFECTFNQITALGGLIEKAKQR